MARRSPDSTAPSRRPLVEDLPPLRRTIAGVGRNIGWVRSHGWAAVAEEHGWQPVDRARTAARRAAWRRRHARPPGAARALLLVGLQRSGTNMVVRGLARNPAVEVYNENDRRAFEHYRLRPEADVAQLVARSRSRVVLLKPLCDTHRVADLLDGTLAGATTTPPRAVWAYRDAAGRASSSVAKFGDGNRRVLAELAAGRGADRWQLQRLSGDSVALVRRLDPDSLSPESGAALLWYVRNRLLFELGLAHRDDLLVMSYRQVLADPAGTSRALGAFAGIDADPSSWADIAVRSSPLGRRLVLDPEIAERCAALEADLDARAAAGLERWGR
ncbi:MAG: hypothetical protein WKF93_00515 [Acidimicrobiales bacterium]